MRVTAAELLQKKAAPPTHPAAGRPQPRPQAKPQGQPPMAPPTGDPAQPGADPAAAGGAPGAGMPGEDATQSPMGDNGAELQQITQALLGDMFNDEKIAHASDLIQKAIPIVGPQHAEKFVKVYSDWVKAHMVMKANLLAMVVMATPQQMMQSQVQQMMQQLQQGMGQQGQGPQPLKVPLT